MDTPADKPPTERSSWRRGLARVATIGAICYAAWCLALYVKQDGMIFPRQYTGAPMKDEAIPRVVERLWIERDPGVRVEGWLVRPTTAPGGRAPLVVLFHGNAELIDASLGRAMAYVARGWAVLMPEFRGYGRSGGTPSQDATVADAVALIERTAACEGVDATTLVLHGRSLGGGVAAQVAARLTPDYHLAGLILESSFRSVASMAAGFGVPAFVVRHPFRTDRVLPGLSCPILLLHGTGDDIIPPSNSQTLAGLNPRARLVLLPGGHNDFPGNETAYWREIDRTLAEIPAARAR